MPLPTRSDKPRPARSTDETIKETFESIVIAFILAFVFRAYVVEAFVIPTGSMAPTLLGRHIDVACEQCGYGYSFDNAGNAYTSYDLISRCPMCFFPSVVPALTPARSGDRLLVQKYIYQFTQPRRWDVLVFRNPQARNERGTPGPESNYIKRLVGLPGEDLYLLDGNVYVRRADASEDAWRIARKTDLQANGDWEAIQRALWQPVYHSAFVPLDDGWRGRPGRDFLWRCPWRPGAERSGWDVGDRMSGWRRSYRFEPGGGEGPGVLRFAWSGYHRGGTDYPYNQPASRRVVEGQPIEDVRLAAGFEPRSAAARIALSTTARLKRQPEMLTATFSAAGRVTLSWSDQTLTARVGAFALDLATDIELWFVDQEALVWVDGQVVLRRAFEVPMSVLKRRPAPEAQPRVTLVGDGGPLTLHHVQLDRDVFYSDRINATGMAPRGALRRTSGGGLLPAEPFTIVPDAFYVLGDNSPISEDSRFWSDVEPWTERRMFGPRRDPDNPREHAGLVPRDLLIGRGMFIYYPAPYPVGKHNRPIVPNFAEMRFVH